MLRKTPVALALATLWGMSQMAAAAESPTAPAITTPSATAASAPAAPSATDGGPTAPPTLLPAVTNTATRTNRRTDDIAATVTVTDQQGIEAAGANSIKDLFRNEVDLSVRSATPRFGMAQGATGRAGTEGLNIRGLEGNQVLMLVDGIRIPNAFSFGAMATGRGDFLALEATQSADVLRGPASTSFGSDGLAGALSLRTLDPSDVIKPGRTAGAFVRFSAAQVDDAVGLTAAGALRQGDWESLLLLSQRDGHETRTQGTNEATNSTRTAPNPLDYQQRVLLGKLFYRLAPEHRLGLTLETLQRRTQTDVLSGRAVPPAAPATPASTAVIDLDALDRVRRQRVSLSHQYEDLNAEWLQRAQTQVHLQDADTRQFAAEDRYSAADRTRDNRYREKSAGLSTQFETNLSGLVAQRLSYGVDASVRKVSAVRDGTPNPTAAPPYGETFPAKPFPDTDYTLAGVFIQDEIELGAAAGLPGRLTLIPALRYDRFKLSPSGEGYSGGTMVSLSDDALTPRLGAIWQISEGFAPYVQWSKGFRAPTPDQVNNGFTNIASGYQSIGNPDLKPETAESAEIGLRGRLATTLGQLQWQASAFDNRYRDFISQEVVRGSMTVADPAIFQYINLAQARIRGAEVRGQWQINRQWSVTGASAWTRGNSTRNGASQPLDTIEPQRTRLGVSFNEGAWAWNADVLHAAAKDASRIAAATTTPFATPAYTVLDIGARWTPGPGWTVAANLNNVTDATYWRWSDVRGVADNSTVKDAYTAPGRNLQLSLRHDF